MLCKVEYQTLKPNPSVTRAPYLHLSTDLLHYKSLQVYSTFKKPRVFRPDNDRLYAPAKNCRKMTGLLSIKRDCCFQQACGMIRTICLQTAISRLLRIGWRREIHRVANARDLIFTSKLAELSPRAPCFYMASLT